MSASKVDFTGPTLGECKIKNPIGYTNIIGDKLANYVADDEDEKKPEKKEENKEENKDDKKETQK